MTIVATEDSRNIEWRKNNVGSTLLQKMGWTEGEGIGRRSNARTTALRALKRQDGLGLGAKIESEGGSSDRSDHFAAVLKNLQVQHSASSTSKKKKEKSKKKKEKRKLTLAQNRVTVGHAQKMRQAKFGEKSAEDMACIFGNREMLRQSKSVEAEEESPKEPKKKKRRVSDSEGVSTDTDQIDKPGKEKKKQKKEKRR